MFPIYNSESDHLYQDDIGGIQSLYGVKQGENDKEDNIIDDDATEKPSEDSSEDEYKPDENEEDDKPDGNRPDENRPDEPKPSETENQAVKILDFNPRRNVESRKELKELTSTPCSKLKIDSSVCLRNNKCLIIAGDRHFWMNDRLKLMRRKIERNDVLFKGLNGKIDSIYRDNDLIHIIQGRNVTTYDSFYAEPIKRTTLSEHFPGLPKHVKSVHSVFKKLSTGVIYIYSGNQYYSIANIIHCKKH